MFLMQLCYVSPQNAPEEVLKKYDKKLRRTYVLELNARVLSIYLSCFYYSLLCVDDGDDDGGDA